MTPRHRAYICRIAAIIELQESPIGVRNLVQQMMRDDPTWDEAAIMAAVAYVRAALARIPFITVRFDVAA